MKMKKTNQNNKPNYKEFVAEMVTNIKNAMSENGHDWVADWKRGGNASLPIRANNQNYKGINLISLWLKQQQNGYASSQWLTFNQISKNGGKVIKGEKGTKVVYFTMVEVDDDAKKSKKSKPSKADADEKVSIPIARQYVVFNRSQSDLDHDVQEGDEEITSDVDLMIKSLESEIVHADQKVACYMPAADLIKMPLRSRFNNDPAYYAALLHEHAHWTGHQSRLDRFSEAHTSHKWSYAREELVAEISAAILCGHFGIESRMDNHASYLNCWMKNLTDQDFEWAVKEATKAVQFVFDKASSAGLNSNSNTKVAS